MLNDLLFKFFFPPVMVADLQKKVRLFCGHVAFSDKDKS